MSGLRGERKPNGGPVRTEGKISRPVDPDAKYRSDTVFVLGAGFTRAFYPTAPLMVDDYHAALLLQEFPGVGFPIANRILQAEVERNAENHINIERLMTRLEGLMPYDYHHGAQHELASLASAVMGSLVSRLVNIRRPSSEYELLLRFAKYCIDKQCHCITFNYDDCFDQALWDVQQTRSVGYHRYWHPNGGYGFFCRPATVVVREHREVMHSNSIYFLKLHGSVNWRPRLGSASPYSTDAIVHFEDWLPPHDLEEPGPQRAEIAPLLEPSSVIIPPLLMKPDLTAQPILRLVWSHAYQVLRYARRVVFIGYSLPVTDIATPFLFNEAIVDLANTDIRVVSYAADEAQKQAVIAAYRRVFPKLTQADFDFGGAVEAVRRLLSH